MFSKMQRGSLAAASLVAALMVPASAWAAEVTAADVAADLRSHPTQVLAAPLGDEAPGNGVGKVLGYPLKNVARVAVGDKQGYVVSSVPLSVGGEALSFGLQARGDVAAPAASPIDLSINLESGEFDLTAPGEPSVRVRRLGDRGPDDAAIVDGRAAFSGIDVEADSVLQATGQGAESFEVLRADTASPTIRWRVILPAGWTLQSAPGNTAVLVDAAGKTAYRVSAPWARDAAGKSLDLNLSVEGSDVVKVDVAVDESTSYPVVVDPDWASTYDFAAGSGAAGWFQINQPVPGQPTLGYTSTFTSVGDLAGLLVWPTGSNSAQYVNDGGDGEEVRGGTRFEAPGTTRIKRIDFGETQWELRQEDCSAGTYRNVDQYLRFVLRDRNTDATVDDLQIGGPGGTGAVRNTAVPVSVPLLDPNAGTPSSTSASITMWTEARTTPSPKWIFPNPRPVSADCNDAVSPFVRVGRVDITLVDSDSPIIDEISGQIRDWAGSAQTAWINGDPGGTRKATGTVRMHDAGAGLDLGGDNDPDRPGSRAPTTVIRATNQQGRSVVYDLSGGQRCDAHHHTPAAEGRICPEALTTQFTAGSPLDLGSLVGPDVPAGERDGPWDLRAEAADLVGHQAVFPSPPGGWRFFVDTTIPRVDSVAVSDEAGNDLRDRWIRASAADGATGKQVRVSATATDPAAGNVLSGVRRVALRWRDIGGASTDLIPAGELQCDDALVASRPIAEPCPSSITPNQSSFPRHLSGGQYVASAEATDFAGNGPSPAVEASTWVDAAPPEVAFTGSLADLDGAWIAPTEPAAIDVTATDPGPHASGIRNARLTFTAENGLEVEPAIDLAYCTAQPGLGAPLPPAPLCPTPGSGSAQVDTASWPHGRVDVLIDAEDAVGNLTPKADADIVVHVDRRPPEVAVSGELENVADRDGWVIPSGDLTTVVEASDEGAGIAKLEIWAKDEQGTRLIEDRTVCSPPAQLTNEPPCPLEVSETFQVDPSAVGDGTATFEVRAIEYTGRIARVRETVKLDGTPPPPVEGLKIERVLMSATASWERPEVPAESSPIVGYEYAFVLAGETNLVWTSTPSTSIPLPELPPGVAAELYVCAVEASGNRSACNLVLDEGFAIRQAVAPCTSKVSLSVRRPATYVRRGSKGQRIAVVEKGVEHLARATYFCTGGKWGGAEHVSVSLGYTTTTAPKAFLQAGGSLYIERRAFVAFPETIATTIICTSGVRQVLAKSATMVLVDLSNPKRPKMTVPVRQRGPRRVSCGNADGAWRVLAYRTGGDRPNRALRQSMLAQAAAVETKATSGDAYEAAFKRWETKTKGMHAHHLIPAFQTKNGAPTVQRIGNACVLNPNHYTNGVFLSDKFHRRQHGRAANSRVVRALRAYTDVTDRNCNPKNARKALAKIGAALHKEDPGSRW